MRAHLTLAGLAVLATACTTPTYVHVETGAEAIEQPTPGQSLLAGNAIPSGRDAYVVRLVGGGGFRTEDGAVAGEAGEALVGARAHAGGQLAFNLGGAELGFVMRQGTRKSGLAPDIYPAGQYGLRLRFTPGGDTGRAFLNVSAEAGVRRVNVSQGGSLLCDVQPLAGGGWAPAPGGTCWFGESRRGETDWHLISYASATLAPTVQLVDGVFLFGGVGVDTMVTGYTRDEVWALYGGVPVYQSCEDVHIDESVVGTWVAGLDVRPGDHLGFLVNVRGGGVFGPDVGPPTVEAALNVAF